jgi:hypothetical protein
MSYAHKKMHTSQKLIVKGPAQANIRRKNA